MRKLTKQDLERRERTEKTYEALGGEFNTSAALAGKLGFPQARVQKYLSALEANGRVFRVTRKCSQVNWFKTQKEADAFRRAAMRAIKEAKDAKRVSLPPTVMFKASTFDKNAPVFTPDHVKPIECPPFKGLGFSETQPKEKPFSSLGIGKYMPDEDAALRRLARRTA